MTTALSKFSTMKIMKQVKQVWRGPTAYDHYSEDMGGVYEELGGAKHPHGGSKVWILMMSASENGHLAPPKFFLNFLGVC